MREIVRFNVKAGSRRWTDRGPDLLRPRGNARDQIRAILVGKPGPFDYRTDGGDWIRVPGRAQVLAGFDSARNFDRFAVWSVKERSVACTVRRNVVPVDDLPGANPKVEEINALLAYHFPASHFAGAYVWKETYPGYWSDHAWGDAGDRSHNVDEGVTNDDMFDWLRRMARSGCIDPDYIIGSRDGEVVYCAKPDYTVEPGGGATSHLWHCHYSQVDHDGERPPRPGGHPW